MLELQRLQLLKWGSGVPALSQASFDGRNRQGSIFGHGDESEPLARSKFQCMCNRVQCNVIIYQLLEEDITFQSWKKDCELCNHP